MASPYSFFRDEAGQPTLRECAVLFLDLLGTNQVRDGQAAHEYLLLAHRALAKARAAGGSDRRDQSISVASWFSDNLALAHPSGAGADLDMALGFTISAAADHQFSLAYDGMFSRGAIACGGFYADEDFIDGPALNRAVSLEHQRSIWPRVVLDETSIQLARASLKAHELGAADSPWRAQLLVDEAGVVFVNYLSALELYRDAPEEGIRGLRRHTAQIRANLQHFDGQERVHDKYRWLASYHDYFLSQLSDQELFEDLYIRPSRPLGSFLPFAQDIPIPDETESLFPEE